MVKQISKVIVTLTLSTSIIGTSTYLNTNSIKAFAETNKSVSQSQENKLVKLDKITQEFYDKNDIKVLLNNGFKIKSDAEGTFVAVKDGFAVNITPEQAKQGGFKVNPKYLSKEPSTVEQETEEKENKIDANNSLITGNDVDSKQSEETSRTVENKKIVEKKLNWWVVLGIGLIILTMLGLLFVPTKKKRKKI